MVGPRRTLTKRTSSRNIRNRPVLRLSKSEYDKIRNTLTNFSPKVQNFSEKTAREGPFLITDGKHWLAVDPQGYEYPRYKSPIYVSGLANIGC